MKKIIILILLTIFFIGCGPSKPVDSEKLLNDFLDTFTLPETTETDLDLFASYEFNGQTIQATWTSSNEDIISNDGLVNRTGENELIDLTVTFTHNDKSVDYEYQVEVIKLPSEDCIEYIMSKLSVPKETSTDLDLTRKVKFGNKDYYITWKSNNTDRVSNLGEIKYSNEDIDVVMTAKFKFDNEFYSKDFNVKVKKFDQSKFDTYFNELNIPTETTKDLFLPITGEIEGHKASITWESNNNDVLTPTGLITPEMQNVDVKLTATLTVDLITVKHEFNVTVIPTLEKLKDQIVDIYAIPGKIGRDILLPTTLINGLTGKWESSNTNVLTNDGKINQNITKPTYVDLTLTITLKGETMTHTFSTSVCPEKHMFIDSTFTGEKTNTIINEKGKLVLKDDALTGTYYSGKIEYQEFTEAVASWSATSSTKATCELFVSLKVGNEWSEYISYGKFGLGLHNAAHDQRNSLIKLSTDEVVVLNNKAATGFQYKLEINRDKLTTPSCEVALIALALNLKNYTYDLDKSLLKNKVSYDVPKLYQHDVPVIGNSICSITSSTMLLKYHGHDFSKINKLEHEYIAGLFKDYGNDIFGNWVYNCVGIGGFGEKSYVKRFFGVNEFLFSLQEVGPMAASIKGDVYYTSTVTGQDGHYHTNGHLICVTGFEITDNETYILINDPNVRGVSDKMTLRNYLNVWRNVSYIVE